jgi:hypothetical protein
VEEEIRIEIRLAYADGRSIPETTVFILCTYTSTNALYKIMDYPFPSLIPLSSPLHSSPGLLSSFYLAEFGASAVALLSNPPTRRWRCRPSILQVSCCQFQAVDLITNAPHLHTNSLAAPGVTFHAAHRYSTSSGNRRLRDEVSACPPAGHTHRTKCNPPSAESASSCVVTGSLLISAAVMLLTAARSA